MRNRPPPLPSRSIVEMARQVLARSALQYVDHRMPADLDEILAVIDEAEAWHEAERAAARAGSAQSDESADPFARAPKADRGQLLMTSAG